MYKTIIEMEKNQDKGARASRGGYISLTRHKKRIKRIEDNI